MCLDGQARTTRGRRRTDLTSCEAFGHQESRVESAFIFGASNVIELTCMQKPASVRTKSEPAVERFSKESIAPCSALRTQEARQS